jgi:hypothetical protein
MTIRNAIAIIPVRDLEAALPWYEKLTATAPATAPGTGIGEGVRGLHSLERAPAARGAVISRSLAPAVGRTLQRLRG